jgi:hypothetical protein
MRKGFMLDLKEEVFSTLINRVKGNRDRRIILNRVTGSEAFPGNKQIL